MAALTGPTCGLLCCCIAAAAAGVPGIGVALRASPGNDAVERFAAKRFYTCRSTIVFLISAMAWAGLRPFGQAFEQFRMVWQR